MAKVQQKSEKITAFGGKFFVLDKFDSILSSVIDSHLGLRSTLIGYQYSEIIRAIFSVFCCGGDCMEDLNLYLKDVLTERPHTRVPSADTVLRGIEELATENTGVFTICGLIAYLENRDGNCNVRFMQAETHRRFFEMMSLFGIHVRSFRADCGSYGEDIVKVVMEHTEKFYIRAERYAGLYEKVKRKTGWTIVEIGFQHYDVQSFPFESFEDVWFYALMMLSGISRLLEKKTRIGSNHPLSLRPMLTSNLLKRRQNRHISADFMIETCSNGIFLLSLQQF